MLTFDNYENSLNDMVVRINLKKDLWYGPETCGNSSHDEWRDTSHDEWRPDAWIATHE